MNKRRGSLNKRRDLFIIRTKINGIYSTFFLIRTSATP